MVGYSYLRTYNSMKQMSNFTILKVEKSADTKRFIDFPHDLYANESAYVPELYIAQEALLDRKKNPYFEHAEADYFLAIDAQGKVVGRIAATVNQAYIEFTQHQAGFFGFFEFIENQEVVNKLLDTAKQWLKERGLEIMLGPCNFSTNETCGTLIENFKDQPFILTTYNFPYYDALLQAYGLRKYTDLNSYMLPTELFDERLLRTHALLEERLAGRGVTIRCIDMKRFDAEIEKFLELYNACWDRNLGFVPMTANEVRHMGKDLKDIVDPDFVLFAEKNGQPIGMALTLPNFNEVLAHVKRGRLFPTGIFQILMRRKKIKTARCVALGVIPEYRKTGLDFCFYARNFIASKQKGITCGEASWILEENPEMNRALQNIGGQVYRKHRIYILDESAYGK